MYTEISTHIVLVWVLFFRKGCATMDFLVSFQLNLYTLVMLIILLVIIRKRLCIETYGKRLLLVTIVLTMIALINEPLAWELDGSPSTIGYLLEYLTNMLELLLGPLIIAVMLQYVRYKVQRERKSMVRLFLTFPPVIFTIVMLIINVITPIYFSVDSVTHVYSTGPIIWVQYVLVSVCYLYMAGYVVYHRNRLNRYEKWIFYVFFFLPIFGMCIQLLNNRIFVSWTSIALSILVVYVFLESTDGERDHMTNLFNRGSFERYMTQRMELMEPYQVVYIDLDRFKEINDLYGHVVGDLILTTFASYLQDVFHSQLCVRLGGDEFMVVAAREDDVEHLLQQLIDKMSASEHDIMRTVQFSYGLQCDEPGITIDELYNLVDRKMYEYKRNNKTLRRRKTD